MALPRRVAVLVTSLSLAAGSCGGGGGGGDTTTSTDAKVTTSGAVGGDRIDVDATVWFGGFKLTFGEATLSERDFGALAVDIETRFENTGDDSATLDATLNLASAGNNYEPGSTAEVPEVPGKATGKGTLSFDVDEEFVFDDAVLTIGNPENNQAVLPLGSEGELVTLKPRPVAVTGTTTAGRVKVDVSGGDLRADIPENHDQVERGHLALTLEFAVTFEDDFAGGYAFGENNLALTLPGATTVAVDDGPIELLKPRTTLPDQQVRFIVDDPADGTYQLVVVDDTESPSLRATIEFEIT